jgi:hypothetical protein
MVIYENAVHVASAVRSLILSTIRIHVWHERALCRVLIVTGGLIAPLLRASKFTAVQERRRISVVLHTTMPVASRIHHAKNGVEVLTG